jgi:hypothetical protein
MVPTWPIASTSDTVCLKLVKQSCSTRVEAAAVAFPHSSAAVRACFACADQMTGPGTGCAVGPAILRWCRAPEASG